MEKSGAVDSYLANRGVDVESLREVSDNRYKQNWAQAVEEFKQGPGRDWPGGQENLRIAQRIMQENGLMDSPSAATLANVWQYMKENNLAVENEELTARQKISEANSYEELQDALSVYRPGRESSGMFGR